MARDISSNSLSIRTTCPPHMTDIFERGGGQSPKRPPIRRKDVTLYFEKAPPPYGEKCPRRRKKGAHIEKGSSYRFSTGPIFAPPPSAGAHASTFQTQWSGISESDPAQYVCDYEHLMNTL